MLIWVSEEISNGYSDEFSSSTQPYFIKIIGDMSSASSSYGTGKVQVEEQAASGEWVPVTNRAYWSVGQDIFRLSPGTKGRVNVHDCKGVTIEIHDSAMPES